MKKFQLLVHIGYPKTASTWLQPTVFNEAKAGFISPWGATSDTVISD